MFPGHFAAGLAIKVAEPRASTLGLMVGAGFLDLVFGICVMVGIEGGRIGHLITPWSHSLVMAALWSILYAACTASKDIRVVAAMMAAVFSHWLLDLLSHGPDMQLWPHSPRAFGFGPHFGGLGGWLEILVTLSGTLAYAHWAWQQEDGRRWGVTAMLLAVALGLEIAVVGA